MHEDEIGAQGETEGPDVFGPQHSDQDKSQATASRCARDEPFAGSDVDSIPYKANDPVKRMVSLLSRQM